VDEEIDVRDDAVEIDLRDRLRFAAGALAADFDGTLTADHAEALVFSSAEGLMATASVTEFVPILAERRARLAFRSGETSAPPPVAAVLVEDVPTVELPVVEAPSVEARLVEGNGSAPEPVFAVGTAELDRLRDRVDLVRVRVADWRAELDRR